MDIFEKHEIFEMELLGILNSGKFLEPLVFGGGTMLRLCYEINRYSADLDFWFIKKISEKKYFNKLKAYLEREYDLTDAKIKYYTLLFEIRSGDYPKRLKIEIRKGVKTCDFQERIAFSKYGTKQVILKVHTLQETMKNKVEAALNRREIRDCFDIEFLARQGIDLPLSRKTLLDLSVLIDSFGDNDFKVTLGAILDANTRKYFISNKFSYLDGKIKRLLS